MQLKSFLFITAMTSIAVIGGCTNKGNGTDATAQSDKPNSDYSLAFTGQTRIKQIVTATPYKVEKIAEKLGKPWNIDARRKIDDNRQDRFHYYSFCRWGIA